MVKLNRKSDLFLVKLSRLSYERPMSFVKHLYLLDYPVSIFNIAFQTSYSTEESELKYKKGDIKEVFYLRTKNFVYGYFIIINKILYIVFRGTRNLINTLTFVYYNISESGFHEGYINSFEQNIEPSFLKYINKIRHKFKRIILTGHSAGAAYSSIAAYKLAMNGFKPEVVGFGCPRFCTKEILNKMKKTIKLRYYANNGDIITKLPLGNYAKLPIYKKHKCDHFLNTLPLPSCHTLYLGVILNNIPLNYIIHKLFVYRSDKTKSKSIKLKF